MTVRVPDPVRGERISAEALALTPGQVLTSLLRPHFPLWERPCLTAPWFANGAVKRRDSLDKDPSRQHDAGVTRP